MVDPKVEGIAKKNGHEKGVPKVEETVKIKGHEKNGQEPKVEETVKIKGHEKNGQEPKVEEEIVKKGHEESIKLANSLLQEFELPPGLLKLADVIEVGFMRSTGYMWIVQKKKVEHNFKMISKLVSYDTEINGYIERKKIKKLKGVKAKEFLLWPPVNEVVVDDPSTGKMHFRSIGGITKTFPVEAFGAGQ